LNPDGIDFFQFFLAENISKSPYAEFVIRSGSFVKTSILSKLRFDLQYNFSLLRNVS